MASQSTWKAHPHLAWAMWGLDEIEATLAAFEARHHKHAGTHAQAESAMAEIRSARDAIRKSVEDPGHTGDAAVARWKEGLETQWTAFEDSLQAYLETLGKQVAEQETVFRARASAQGKAWQQAIDNLHRSAASFGNARRHDIQSAVRRLEAEADAAKAKLDTLNKSEGASWETMKSTLAETRAALGRAHQAVIDAFEADHAGSARP
jgi:chromosome segregation ATPase